MFEFLACDFLNTYYTDHIARSILSSFPYYILLTVPLNNIQISFRDILLNKTPSPSSTWNGLEAGLLIQLQASNCPSAVVVINKGWLKLLEQRAICTSRNAGKIIEMVCNGFAVLTSDDVRYLRYTESILEDYGITRMMVTVN